MFAKKLLVVVVAALLLATLVMPAAAAMPRGGEANPVQTMTWSVPGGSLSLFVPGRNHLNGGCESGGASGCPY
jgi:hypothetical protein